MVVIAHFEYKPFWFLLSKSGVPHLHRMSHATHNTSCSPSSKPDAGFGAGDRLRIMPDAPASSASAL
jgi:hypothetical protein